MTNISVCMATYNGEKYIFEQIESILKQLGENDELIISDDKSKDNTLGIIRRFNDKRIKIYIHENPGLYTANFENALKYAKGKYIFLADQDDIWMPDKVQVMLNYLNQGYDFVMHNAKIVDKDLNIIKESRNEYFRVGNGFIRNLVKSRYLGCCFGFKRNVLKKSLPFPKNYDLSKHDTWLSLNAELNYNTIVINEPLILYRRHESNASTGGETSSSLINIIKIRLYLVYHLFIRKFDIDRKKLSNGGERSSAD